MAWGDFVGLVEAFGFQQLRTQGSHHIYARAGVLEMLNLQQFGGEAKPYQIRQFLKLVEAHGLTMAD